MAVGQGQEKDVQIRVRKRIQTIETAIHESPQVGIEGRHGLAGKLPGGDPVQLCLGMFGQVADQFPAAVSRPAGYADLDHGINPSRMKVHSLPELSNALAAGTWKCRSTYWIPSALSVAGPDTSSDISRGS